MVIVCVHVMGCFWYYSARIMDFGVDTWIVVNHLQDQSYVTKYMTSIYWAITTAATVGYGDITPGSQFEVVVAVGWMVVGVGFYSFTVGSLSSFLTSIDTRDSVLSMKMASIQEFSRQTGISQETKGTIREAVKYNAYKMGNVWTDKHSLFSELPKALRQEVAMSMYNGVAKDFPIFKLFENSLLTIMMPLFRPMKLNDNEYVYTEGAYPDQVYFIIHGRVGFVILPTEILYKSFLRGSYFGEVELIQKVNRLNNAMCIGLCEMLYLSKTDFLRVMEDYPADFKIVRKIAAEKAHRTKLAKVEILELLKLKATFGSLSKLAGQKSLTRIEYDDNKDEPALVRIAGRVRFVEEHLQNHKSAVDELSSIILKTQELVAEAMRKTRTEEDD